MTFFKHIVERLKSLFMKKKQKKFETCFSINPHVRKHNSTVGKMNYNVASRVGTQMYNGANIVATSSPKGTAIAPIYTRPAHSDDNYTQEMFAAASLISLGEISQGYEETKAACTSNSWSSSVSSSSCDTSSSSCSCSD